MIVIILAGAPSPEFELSVCIGILIIILVIRRFLRRAARPGSRRHMKLAVIGLCAGPILGFLIAALHLRYGNVSSIDRAYTYKVLIGIGLFAGVFGSLLIAAFAKARTPAKSDRVQDDGSNG